ncbi:GtrA family protein [Streptomyces sp. NPDC020490]|uniref:GtrA family protein n=1 Tax=Streptomyces sp. NPDC020490 TaxID=3365078 RepID=UPI0037B38C9D
MRCFRTVPVHTDEPRAEAELSPRNAASTAWGARARALLESRILRFAVVGGVGTVVNTAVLYVLHGPLGLPLLAASAVAVEVAVVNNYLLNDWWTFAARAPSLKRFGKFNVSMLTGLGVNVLVLWILVHGGVHLVVANLLAIGAAFTVNYVSSALWVWDGTRGSIR